MSDSDWAVKHSTSGQVFVFQRAAVSWGSKKQPTVALSSTEAEIMAASEAAKEALSLRKYIRDFKLGGDTPTQLFVDNQASSRCTSLRVLWCHTLVAASPPPSSPHRHLICSKRC